MSSREAWKTSGFLRGVGIPAPSGQFTVGCVDLMQQVKEGEEDVFVRLFYPVATPAGPICKDRYAVWYPHKNYVRGYLHYSKSKALGLKTFAASAVLTPRIPAVLNTPFYSVDTSVDPPTATAPPASAGSTTETTCGDANGSSAPSFPVIVFSHGLGAMRTTYSGICCDLTSHGYVVASVEHRDLSACVTLRRVPGGPDEELVDEWVEHHHLAPNEQEFPLRNKQVLQRASEVSRALDLLALLNDGGEIRDKLGSSFDFSQFKGRLDVSRPAVMGHSFGGGTTLQTLSDDSRFKCGIAMDTWMYPIHNSFYDKVIEQPLLFINSFDFQWKENVQKMMKLVKPPNERGMSTCRVVTLIDSNHFNQGDVHFIMPTFMVRSGGMISRIDPVLVHQVNQEICCAFLKRHQLQDPVHQQPIPNLDGTEGHSEHILFGTNVDLSEEESQESQESPKQKETLEPSGEDKARESPRQDEARESPGQDETQDESQENTLTQSGDAKNETVSSENGTTNNGMASEQQESAEINEET